jgi:integrase
MSLSSEEPGHARQGFFSEQELAAVVSHLPADLRDFVRFAAATGMRKGEVASLAWSDIDGDTITLRGEHSKNGEARIVPLVGELAEIIARRQAARRIEVEGRAQLCELIFHRHGAAVERFNKSWATACRKANCPGKLFHDLRRTAVRSMVQAGVNPQVAKKISGHKTDSMFQRYSILTTDDLAAALPRTQEYREATAKQARVVAMR